MYLLLSDRKKNLKISNFFPLFLEFHDKSGKSDKNRESGRQHIKSAGLECLTVHNVRTAVGNVQSCSVLVFWKGTWEPYVHVNNKQINRLTCIIYLRISGGRQACCSVLVRLAIGYSNYSIKSQKPWSNNSCQFFCF